LPLGSVNDVINFLAKSHAVISPAQMQHEVKELYTDHAIGGIQMDVVVVKLKGPPKRLQVTQPPNLVNIQPYIEELSKKIKDNEIEAMKQRLEISKKTNSNLKKAFDDINDTLAREKELKALLEKQLIQLKQSKTDLFQQINSPPPHDQVLSTILEKIKKENDKLQKMIEDENMNFEVKIMNIDKESTEIISKLH